MWGSPFGDEREALTRHSSRAHHELIEFVSKVCVHATHVASLRQADGSFARAARTRSLTVVLWLAFVHVAREERLMFLSGEIHVVKRQWLLAVVLYQALVLGSSE